MNIITINNITVNGAPFRLRLSHLVGTYGLNAGRFGMILLPGLGTPLAS